MTSVFITLTNYENIFETINCYKSLEKSNFLRKLNSVCIDTKSYEILKSKGYSCEIFSSNSSDFKEFEDNFNQNIPKIVYKFNTIYKNLLSYDYVCYTETNVLYENSEFFNYLLQNIDNNDILILNNETNSVEDNISKIKEKLSTDFMFIKSSRKTINFFNPKSLKINSPINNFDDQKYITENISNLIYKKLPLELFCNCKYYYENFTNINPYLINFNWQINNKPNIFLKKYDNWFYSGSNKVFINLWGMRRSGLHCITNDLLYHYGKENNIDLTYYNDHRTKEFVYNLHNYGNSVFLYEDKLKYLTSPYKEFNVIIIRDVYNNIISRFGINIIDTNSLDNYVNVLSKIIKEFLNIEKYIPKGILINYDRYIKDQDYRNKILTEKFFITKIEPFSSEIPHYGGGATFKNPEDRFKLKIPQDFYDKLEKKTEFLELVTQYFGYDLLEKLKKHL